MAIYTVGRRRVIIALLLTSALLLTLDLRGTAVIDRARDGFSFVMQPVEDAVEVVTTPVGRAWDSYRNYDDLERENQALREQLDRTRGALAAAEASVIDYNALLALQDLPSLTGIDTEVAEVVGRSANNIDQIVEINKGSLDGVQIGMPVVNRAGLIGRITSVNLNTSKVLLVTDSRFAIPVEILSGTGADDDDEPVTTTPSGRTPDEVEELSTPPTDPDPTLAADAADDADADNADADASGPTTTTPLDVLNDDRFPLPQAPTDGEEPTTDDAADPVVTTTTTTTLPPAVPVDGSPIPGPSPDPDVPDSTLPVPDDVAKEFGALEGRGQGRLPRVRFLQDNPSLSVLQEGDLVQTAGGNDSLAPADIPVGRVINRADRPGVAGPVLEIELWADLDQLDFVQVVLYRPLSEVGG